MTVTVYRLTKLRNQDQIFPGLGGLYAEGRWTLRGKPIVYTSGSISLAVLHRPSYGTSVNAGWSEAILKVPSAVVVEEWNYLLNPSMLTSITWLWGNPSDTV